MANNATTQVPSGGATIIDRRRFLKQTASATAVVSVPYLAGKTVAFGKQVGKGADAALDRAQRTGRHGRRPPGVIAVVQRGPHREVHSFGVRNIRSGLPLRAKDHMRIASVAKALSGAVALSLVSKGVLSLNDTIGELLPKLPETWHAVRLWHWLNHTSGIPDFSQDEDFLAAVMAHPKEAPPPEELLSYVEDEPLNFEPGTRYEYSNSDNIAVGLMIEAATNRSYESRLQKHVFGPLGLTETSLPAGANLPKAFIHGYDPSESPPEDLSEILAAGWFWASGGIVSTPEDLNRFIRGYVGGRLFGSEQRQVIEGGSSEPPGPGKNAAGLALFRYRTRCGTVWEHTGNTPGYTQFAAASPDGERSVTVSVNAPHPDDGQTSRLRGAEARGGSRRVRRADRQIGRLPGGAL